MTPTLSVVSQPDTALIFDRTSDPAPSSAPQPSGVASLPESAASQPSVLGEVIIRSPVRPGCIFAAGHKSFTALVRGTRNGAQAREMLFDFLPLAENGWNFTTAKMSRVGETDSGDSIWKLER